MHPWITGGGAGGNGGGNRRRGSGGKAGGKAGGKSKGKEGGGESKGEGGGKKSRGSLVKAFDAPLSPSAPSAPSTASTAAVSGDGGSAEEGLVMPSDAAVRAVRASLSSPSSVTGTAMGFSDSIGPLCESPSRPSILSSAVLGHAADGERAERAEGAGAEKE
jgi:hypothetical protein